MAFVGFTKENDTRARVNLIHYFPSELDHGILEQGALVDTIPEPDHIPGKGAVLYINPQTNELWYEYVDDPVSADLETLKADNQMLGQQLAEKELQILALQEDNRVLGQSIVDLELKINQLS
jgi:hypothetical protein